MACLDFKEIPRADRGTHRDTFEMFAREVLVAGGFKIVEEPDRGADFGRDLIAEERRSGPGGSNTRRWLISCKHTIHGNKAVSAKEDAGVTDRLTAHKCQGFLAFYSMLPSTGLGHILRSLPDGCEYLQYDCERIERELLSDAAGEAIARRFMPISFARWKNDVIKENASRHTTSHHHGHTTQPTRLRLSVTVTNHRERCAHIKLDEEMTQGSTKERFDLFPTLYFGTMEYGVAKLNVVVGLKRVLCHVTSDHGKVDVELTALGRRQAAGPTLNAGDVWEFIAPAGEVLKGYAVGEEPLCRIRTPSGQDAHARLELTAARSDIDCSFSSGGGASPTTEKIMKRFLQKASFQQVSNHLLLSEMEIRSL